MKIYFVRHGEVESNVERRPYQESTEPLNDRGRAQAAFVAKRFATIDIDGVLSSTMTRAHDTALAIAGVTGHEVITTDLLCERRRPSDLKGLRETDPKAIAVGKELTSHLDDLDYRYSDEETFAESRERAQKAIDFIVNAGFERVAVATHGAFLKIMLGTMFLGEEFTHRMFLKFYYFLTASNTGITMVESLQGERADGRSPWRLLTLNDYAHLGEIK